MFIKTCYLVVAVLFALPLAALLGTPSDEPGQHALELRIANFRGLIGVGGKYQRDQLHVFITAGDLICVFHNGAFVVIDCEHVSAISHPPLAMAE